MSNQEELMESLKKDVRSLLIATKEGLAPQELEKEYKMMIGNPMPLRSLGYQSIHGLINDIPDVVSVEHSKDGSILLKAIVTEATKGIADLVAKQKSSKPRTRSTLKRSRFSSYRSQPSLPRRGRTPPILPAAVKCELRSLLAWSPVLLSEFEQQFKRRFGRTFQYTRYGFYSMFEVLEAAADFVEVQQTRMGSLVMLKKRTVVNKMQEKVSIKAGWKQFCSVEVQPAKLHVTPVNTPPETPAQEISLETLPILKLPEMKIQPKPDVDFFTESLKKVEEEIKSGLMNIGIGAIVDQEMKEKIRFVVAQKPEGLLLSRLPADYKNIFEEDLPFKTLGFLSVKELVGALSDILHIESKEHEPDWLLFDREKAKSFQTHTKEKELPSSELWVDSVSFQSAFISSWEQPIQDTDSTEKNEGILIPEVRFVTKVAQQIPQTIKPSLVTFKEDGDDWIPPDAIEDGCLHSMPEMDECTLVAVYVESITSPSQFYIRLCSKETSDRLVDMMFEMRRCYSNEEVQKRYRMREKFFRAGQVCCLRTAGEVWWYRIVIHRLVSEEKVEVFYIDFGNMETVEKSHICLLKCCFSVLPAQAVPAALMCVRPVQKMWRADAVIRFQILCGVNPLVGLVGEYVDGVLNLFLCDTSTDKDMYLHEVLQKEGHALICETNDYVKSLFLFSPAKLYLKPALKPSNFPTAKQDTGCEDCIKKENEQSKDATEIQIEKNEKHLEMPYLEPIPLEEVWDESWISQSSRDKNANGPTNLVKINSSSSATDIQETNLKQRMELEQQMTYSRLPSASQLHKSSQNCSDSWDSYWSDCKEVRIHEFFNAGADSFRAETTKKMSNNTLYTSSPLHSTTEFTDVEGSSSLGSVEETTERDLSLSFQELGISRPALELREQKTALLKKSTGKSTNDQERCEITSNTVEDFYISLIDQSQQSSVKSVPTLQNLSLERPQQPAAAVTCPSEYTKDHHLITEKERERSSSITLQTHCSSAQGGTGLLNVPRSSTKVALGPSARMAMGTGLLNWTPWFKKTNM